MQGRVTVRTEESTTEPRRPAGLPVRLGVELLIGLGLAAILVLVAWASSDAIRFVYGGY